MPDQWKIAFAGPASEIDFCQINIISAIFRKSVLHQKLLKILYIQCTPLNVAIFKLL